MEVFWGIALGLLAVVFYKDRQVLRIEKDSIWKFFKFVLTFKLIFLVLYVVLFRIFEVAPPSVPAPPLHYLPMVWWEDVLFSLIPIYYGYKFLPRPLATAVAIIVSFFFALGHLYQGWIGLLLGIYPFFISYRYGKKHGYGTVMICHVIYDVMVISFALLQYAIIGK